MKSNKGITLVVLVITIIVMLILAGIIISLTTGENNVIDHAKWAGFSTEFREIEEKVIFYQGEVEMNEAIDEVEIENEQDRLPVLTRLTDTEIKEIKDNNTTLLQIIEETSGKLIDEVNLYWIDKDEVNCKQKYRYIIDVETKKIYRYEGKYIYKKTWHTLDQGTDGISVAQSDDLFDAYIRLTLYYPAGSTNRQWRLSEEGEIRYDENLMWKDYTGSILVKLSEVENVWIRYNLNDKEVIVPPKGRVLVDIQPDSSWPNLVNKVKVKIVYDKEASLKEYKVGNSDWQNYSGEFYVTENTMIEARAKVIDNISDNNGNVISTSERWGRDYYYVGNIGIEESEYPAPTITKLEGGEGEVARAQITYPEQAVRKIYKINYGEEQEYTNIVGIQNKGTYLIAYYYANDGKRSKLAFLYIKEDGNVEIGTGTPNSPGSPVGKGGTESIGTTNPSYIIPAPEINVSPTEMTTSVNVTVTSPANATKTYIKIGDNSYQEYTSAITLMSNTVVKAYYMTNKGEISNTARRRINNIKSDTGPYIKFTLNPDSVDVKYGAEKVNVTIETDGQNLEYSTNGVEYTSYTGILEIKNNCRLYARARNSAGTTVEYIDITNIGGTIPPVKERLAVRIDVSPEPKVSTQNVDEVTVSIKYDDRAVKRYYTIGEFGELKNYTEPFKINENTTIYAYALSSTGYGKAEKVIDNLNRGLSEPVIIGNPPNSKTTTKTIVTIDYDRNAIAKKYRINNGNYIDYTGEIEVTENCTVTAYCKNAAGSEATSRYKVSNIIKETPTVLIDKGKYYILKLTYPVGSTGREYKFENDDWKSYKDDGILLVKPEYKDDLLNSKGEVKVKIENENGDYIDFNGDYYFVTEIVTEMIRDIAMRWNRMIPDKPQVVLNTIEPTRQVNATIVYSDIIVRREYRILRPDGTSTDWQEYTGTFTINQNNTIIYARGQDEAEVWSDTTIYKVSNIDEEPPSIRLITDLEKASRAVSIKVEASDDGIVSAVRWEKGVKGESYFESSGNTIINNTSFLVNENGIYTIYAEDGVGNKSTATIQVGNIDLSAPELEITISPDIADMAETTVTIDYGDSVTKKYKIGESNQNWDDYKNPIKVTSSEVLNNNWKNSDGTVTVFAKGIDSVGNEITITKKILHLDLNAPSKPVISSNYGYPILTAYGINSNGTTTITYDNMEGTRKLYSIDNGNSWNTYTGAFSLTGSGTVMAKCIKANGLESSNTATITMPTDVLSLYAYDGNLNTRGGNVGNGYLLLDNSMIGRKIFFNNAGCWTSWADEHKVMEFYTGTPQNWGTKIGSTICIPEGNSIYDIPGNAKFIRFFNIQMSEIGVYNVPKITASKIYAKLSLQGNVTMNSNVTIEYDDTSVQKKYKIDNGTWQDYVKGTTISLLRGTTIYAKGIDRYGTETDIVQSLASEDSILSELAYDGDLSTRGGSMYDSYMLLDESIRGKKIFINYYGYWSGWTEPASVMEFYTGTPENWGTKIGSTNTLVNGNKIYDVPTNAKFIRFYNIQIKEIGVYTGN